MGGMAPRRPIFVTAKCLLTEDSRIPLSNTPILNTHTMPNVTASANIRVPTEAVVEAFCYGGVNYVCSMRHVAFRIPIPVVFCIPVPIPVLPTHGRYAPTLVKYI